MWKRRLNRAEMTLFKKQNRITVVNHAVRDIVVSEWSSGKKSDETDCDEAGRRNWKHFSRATVPSVWYNGLQIITEKVNSTQLININENNFVQSISHFEKISRL